MKNTFYFALKLAFLSSLALLNSAFAQTFNYGTGNVSGNTAPFASGNANVTVTGNDVVVTGNTTMTAGTYNFANFTVNSGVTITVTGTGSPLIIKCTGTFTNNGLIAANGGSGGVGTTSVQGSAGVGVAGGANGGLGGAAAAVGSHGTSFGSSTGRGAGGGVSTTRSAGGGGGAFSANGTAGFNGSSATGGAGGALYGNSGFTVQQGANSGFFSAGQTTDGDRWILAGSGGGGGGGRSGGFSQPRGGGGGAGGGAIQISANNVVIGNQAEAIAVKGGNGGTSTENLGASGGAGGGGAGGSINIQYFTYSNASSGTNLKVNGGAGGVGFSTGQNTGRGGPGAAGRLLLEEDVILCTAPSGSSTSFSANSVTTNSATLNWVRGNGDEVIVIVREGSAVSGGPVSSTSYTANNNYTLGQDLGGGKVVYIGSGTSVNVTNLPNLNTTYHVSVFEFFNAGGGCYQLSGTQLTGTFSTNNGPMNYLGSTNVQQTGNSPLGSTNQPVLRLEVSGGPGTSPALTLSGITFNTIGTTNVSDLTGARIYYTGSSSTFAATTQFGTSINNPSGSHNVSGSQTLAPGTNYFWLVYDVSIGGTTGNLLDAQITSINVGGSQTPTETNPTGNRVITSLMSLTCGYTFAHFTPTWISNVGQSGITTVASGATNINGQRWPNQSFASGFNFEYNGTTYNSFGIHSKGFIWFGSTSPDGTLATPISSTVGYEGAIAPFAFNMIAHSASSTTPQVTIRYTGTAPNRVCIIEWTAMRPSGNTGGLCELYGYYEDWNRYDFQLHLYENGGANANRIEFVYRNMSSFCVDGNSASAQVGLRGPSNTDYLNRQGSGNSAHASTSANGVSNAAVISHGASNFFNGNGGMRFTPTFQKPVVSPSPTASNICPDVTVELSTTSTVSTKQWYNNNLPISGANGSTYNAENNGTHILVVTQSGCSKVSDPVTVTIETCCQTVFGVDKIEACDPIVWIDGNTYSSNNNTATHLLVGASQNGCDSLVTLNLTFWPCTKLQFGDCGATNVTMDQTLRAINVFMPAYRFHVTGPNNGGPGWVNNTYIYDSPTRAFKFLNIPGAYWGQTYSVLVASGDGLGNFGAYGDACNVTLDTEIPSTKLQTNDCGVTVAANITLFANQINGALAYRFRITGNNTANWSNNTTVVTKTERKIKMSEANGVIWGQTYVVEVAIQDASGNWGEYGIPCNVTIAVPETQLQLSQCNIVDVPVTTVLSANAVFGATGYRFKIVGPNNGGPGWINDEYILNRTNKNMTFAMVPGSLQGEEYFVQVSVKDQSNVYVPYGNICTIKLFGIPQIVINENEIFENNKTINIAEFGVEASHNPFTTNFGIQVLNANDIEIVYVTIYDMSGKLIESNSVNPMDIENARFGENLASGMYMIEVKQGSNQATFRQVKN